jgi:exodeoxyribonuclease VII large subunit
MLAHRLQQAVRRRLERDAIWLARWPRDFAAALARDLQRRHGRVDQMEGQLKLLDPMLVLQRGYALITDAGGHAVTSVDALQPGQDVTARLADGEVDLTVKPSGS